MKYTFQWKDPDYDDGEIHARRKRGEEISQEEWNKLYQLGAKEYIAVEFDTDTMTATVRGHLV